MNYPPYGNYFAAPFPPNGNQNYNQVMVAQAESQNLQLNSPVTEQSRAVILAQLQFILNCTGSLRTVGGSYEKVGVNKDRCGEIDHAVNIITTAANAITARYEEEVGNLKRELGLVQHDNQLLIEELQEKDRQIKSLKGEAISPEKIKEIARVVAEETVKTVRDIDEKSGDGDSLSIYSGADDDDLVDEMGVLQISPPQALFNMGSGEGALVNVESANPHSPAVFARNEVENTAVSVGAMTKQETGFRFGLFSNSAKNFKLVNNSGRDVGFVIRSRPMSLVTAVGLGVGMNHVGGNVALDRSQKHIERNTVETGASKVVELATSKCTITLFERLTESKFRVFFTGKKIKRGQKFTIMERHVRAFVTEVNSLSDLECLEN